MDIIKLVIVFAVIVIIIGLKQKLWVAILGGIVSASLLYQLGFAQCLELVWKATSSWDTISIILILYFITFLQRLLEKRSQLKMAQQDLNGIFNNRRINASLAPVFVGLLPSAAAAIICGDIVNDAVKDDLDIEEKAFVTSYFRHIPESFLPTYSSVVIMISLSGVSLPSFILGMLPLVIVLFALGHIFYLRKIPKETGTLPSENKWRDLLNLVGHLWTLIGIIVLIIAFNVDTIWAILAIIVLAYPIYRFKIREMPFFLKSAFEPVLIVSSYLIMVFKEILSASGVIESLPAAFSALPIPTYLIFAIVFFVGALVSGSTAIIATCTVAAFTAIPDGGMPLMVLLMSFTYAAMQISPTHVCLAVITEYFHTTTLGIVKKTIPVISVFCVIVVGYYLLLRMFF